MEPVIFTANEGYHIDHNSINDVMGRREGSDVYTQNGVTVERISDTQYVAYGTPTGQVHIWIPNGHEYENWTTTTAATCTTAGAKERVCKYDSNIKETAEVAIDPDAHSYEFKDFTWTGSEADGYTAAVANYVCEHDATHTTSVDATIGEPVVTDPTCTEPGKTTYTATVAAADSPDGEKHEEGKDAKAMDPTDHKWKFEGFTWTGNETDGYTAAKANYVCEHDATHTTSVDATIGEPVVTDPTCTEPGKTTYTATVAAADSPDGEKHEEGKDAKAMDPTDHKWKFEDFTWTGSEADGYTAAKANYVCEHDATHTTSVDATIGKPVVTDPTCTEPGKTTYTATVAAADSPDGEKHEEGKDAKSTDPIQHSWGEPTYTWSDDNSSVTAKRECANNTTHVETETVDATSEVTRKATCMENGEMTYTSASFDNEAFTVQTKKEDIAIDPNAHKWDTGKETKPATEQAEGVKTFTCTVCKATKTETIPKLAKKANPLTIKAKTVTVKYSAVKKKAQTLAVGKVITFTKKGQGKMTYTLVSAKKGSKSFKKKFAVNKTTGKVTVKKGLKKGTYKVKVKVKAAGNANYNASAVKTVTFNVKVK